MLNVPETLCEKLRVFSDRSLLMSSLGNEPGEYVQYVDTVAITEG